MHHTSLLLITSPSPLRLESPIISMSLFFRTVTSGQRLVRRETPYHIPILASPPTPSACQVGGSEVSLRDLSIPKNRQNDRILQKLTSDTFFTSHIISDSMTQRIFLQVYYCHTTKKILLNYTPAKMLSRNIHIKERNYRVRMDLLFL